MSVPMPARKVEPPDGFESLADAARRRGVSERTLRRQIEAGIVPAEMFQRPQGSVWFVPIPETEAAKTRRRDGSAANDSESAKGGDQAAENARFLIEVMSEHLKIKDARINVLSDRIAALEREAATLRATQVHLDLERGRDKTLRLQAEHRASELEAELERLKARSWWDKLRGR